MTKDEMSGWWKMYSVKLAALASAAGAVLTANPELLVGLISIIPGDPLLRLVFSGCVGGIVFLVPFLARIWPQGEADALREE